MNNTNYPYYYYNGGVDNTLDVRLNNIDIRLNELDIRMKYNTLIPQIPQITQCTCVECSNVNIKKKNNDTNIDVNMNKNDNKVIKKKKKNNKKKKNIQVIDINELKYEELNYDLNTLDDFINLGKLYKDDLEVLNGFNMNDYFCTKTKKYNINLKQIVELIEPLSELKDMIGLEKVKTDIITQILYYLFELNKGNPKRELLHTIINGPPGVGKSSLGLILSKIYLKLNATTNNKFKIVGRSELIAGYCGQTAIKTQKVIDECEGGVLFIDEAYSLGDKEQKDGFSKECIDTLTKNLDDPNKNFICILAGYENDMNNCLFKTNQGLKRRFPFTYTIDKYNSDELNEIFKMQINKSNWKYDIDEHFLKDFFNKNKDKFEYYGGDINNLIQHCKMCHAHNLLKREPTEKKNINMKDLIDGYNKFELKKIKQEYISGMYL